MRIITISGKAECGKDTSAKLLKERLEELGYSAVIYHYADLLKFICEKFFGWDGKKNEEGRTLLQYVGTEVVRAKYPDYWVEFVKGLLKLFPNEWDFVIIPDTRFPNEIDLVKQEFDCAAVRVTRPNYENHLTEEQRTHASETSLDSYSFDYELTNLGNMPSLEEEVVALTNNLFESEDKKSLMEKIKENF